MSSESISQWIKNHQGELLVLVIAGILIYAVFSLGDDRRFDTDTVIEYIQTQMVDDADWCSRNYSDINSELLLQSWKDGAWYSEWDDETEGWMVQCDYWYDDSKYIARWIILDDGSILDNEFFITQKTT